MTKLAGKIALVTGGRGGIGRAIVKRFLTEGAHVYAADLTEQGSWQNMTPMAVILLNWMSHPKRMPSPRWNRYVRIMVGWTFWSTQQASKLKKR